MHSGVQFYKYVGTVWIDKILNQSIHLRTRRTPQTYSAIRNQSETQSLSTRIPNDSIALTLKQTGTPIQKFLNKRLNDRAEIFQQPGQDST